MIEFPDIIAGQPWELLLLNSEDLSACAVRVDLQCAGENRTLCETSNGTVFFPGHSVVAMRLDGESTRALKPGRCDVAFFAQHEGDTAEAVVGSVSVIVSEGSR